MKDVSEIIYLPYLLTLQAAENQIASIDFLTAARDSLHYLQQLTLSKNKLTALPALPLPRLTVLNLNENEIATAAAFEGHANLLNLNLAQNKLLNCAGISNLPKLKVLDLSQNEIGELTHGLHGLTSLEKLVLAKNKLVTLDGFPHFPALTHLVLSEN